MLLLEGGETASYLHLRWWAGTGPVEPGREEPDTEESSASSASC